MQNCEFCRELSGHPDNRYRQIYRDSAETRIVAETSNFVAMPTLGQIFPGSLLILPRFHIETCAQLSIGYQHELVEFVQSVSFITKQFGELIFFEHGATACTGGSCGIYHAHLHVVPLPVKVSPKLLFEEHRAVTRNLLQTFDSLKGCNHYLLIGDQDNVAFTEVDQLDITPSSQFFRRRLAERFGVDRPWDWRETKLPEPDLIATISAFRSVNVAQ